MLRTRRSVSGAGVLLMLLVGVSIGCGKEADQSSPEATVRSFFEAWRDGDGDRAAACIHGDENTKRYLRAMGGMNSAIRDLERAVKAEWGDEAWSHFAHIDMVMEFDDEMEELDKVEYRIEGDRAYASMPGEPDDLELVLMDGKWYIDVTAKGVYFPTGREAGDAAKGYEAMAEAARNARDRVGQEGVTPQQLMMEIVQAMDR